MPEKRRRRRGGVPRLHAAGMKKNDRVRISCGFRLRGLCVLGFCFDRRRSLADALQKGWLTLELPRQAFDGVDCRRTDVMLHALDIVVDGALVQSEQLEKIGQQLVPVGDVERERFARRGENQAAVLFVFEEPLGIEFLHHVGDACLRDGEPLRDVHYPGVALGVDELEDLFQIILNS